MTVAHKTTSPCRGEVDAKRRVGGRLRYTRSKEQTAFARALRQNMTDAERKLWFLLKRDQLEGFTFRRQHPIDKYVVDFWCSTLKLAIELDGGQHGMRKGIEKDVERSIVLRVRGVTVLRFWNPEVMKNIEGVLGIIRQTALALQNGEHPPTLTLPPAGGGELTGEVDR